MSEQRDNFLFYASWLEIIEQNYKDDIDMQRELIHNIVLYGIRGEENYKTEKMFMQQAFAQIDSAKDKHNKRVDAGRKGGKSGKGESKKRYGNKNASKTQPNDNVNVNVNNIDNLHCQLGDRQKRFKRFADPICGEEIKAEDIQRGHYEMRDGERYWVVDEQ